MELVVIIRGDLEGKEIEGVGHYILAVLNVNGYQSLLVAHLGDGNLHYSAYPSQDDPALYDAVIETVEDEVQAMGGSFSAEHGVGLMKLNSMRRRKDPVALDVMRLLKATLDPQDLMNPGKVIPQ